MKVLVTGYNGQLGFDVIKELESRHIHCKGVDMADFDITDSEATKKYIDDYAPDAVIHCAAYTAVDKAEDDEENCFKVNTVGSENIAKVCGKNDIKMVYVSTDYVYGGSGTEPFETTDPTNPCNIYGKSKLQGEEAVAKHCKKYFIVRTSWVFGINGNNFVKTMLRLGDSYDKLNVVCDQIGSPTYTPDLAKLLCNMIETDKYGIYHGTNEGLCSWAEFAEEIMKQGKKSTVINPVSTAEYGAKANRPLNSRLSKKCLDDAGFSRLPSWQDALSRFIKEL